MATALNHKLRNLWLNRNEFAGTRLAKTRIFLNVKCPLSVAHLTRQTIITISR